MVVPYNQVPLASHPNHVVSWSWLVDRSQLFAIASFHHNGYTTIPGHQSCATAIVPRLHVDSYSHLFSTTFSISSVCAITSSGSVACWGDDEWGQSSPPSGSFVQVSAGGGHSCGIDTSGSVQCWGKDFDGQSSPPSGSFVQVSAGSYHSCGVTSSGSAECWGTNSHGQSSPPSGSFVQVSAGWFHSCGVTMSGDVTCWGFDSSGQSTPPAGFSAF